MIKQFKSIFFTDTGKDTSVVFLGTLINVAVGGLFFIFAPKILGPQNYGLFSVVLATGLMAVNFANLGIDTGILRFIKPDNQQNNNRILKLALKAYLVTGLAVLVLGFILSGVIARTLGEPQISNLLKIAFAGTIFTLLSNFFAAGLQSQKKFKEASIIAISSNVARLAILALGAYFATVDLYFLTYLFFFVTIISVILGPLFLPLDFLKTKEEHVHFNNFFGYNFWVAASLAISAIPVDNYLLLKISGATATGLFAAPMKILTTTYQFAGGFSRVLAPRFSSFDTQTKAKEFAKKALPWVLTVSIGIILLGFFAPLLRFLWGNDYQQSIQIFRILTVGMAAFFADTIPIALILYYFGKSKVAFYVTVWHYMIYTVLLFLLIQRYSAIGAAMAFSASEIITLITLSVYVIYKFNKANQ